MKKLLTLAFAGSLLALSGMTAVAQPEPGDAGVFADSLGTQTTLNTGAFAEFQFHVIAFDLFGLPNAFEFGLELPAGITLTGEVLLAGPGPGNIGGPTNVIAFTGACLDVPSVWVMATYSAVFLSAPGEDLAVVLGPSSPSSFNPPAPGYSQCDNTLLPFGVASDGSGVDDQSAYPDGALIINPTQDPPVAVENENFGQIKARF